jgi:hypothetical protein
MQGLPFQKQKRWNMSTMLSKIMLLAGLGLVTSTVQGENVNPTSETATAEKPRHVVLLGASIGMEWSLPELPKRVNERRYSFEALQAWEYDKSEIVEETLMRPARKFRLTPGYVKGFFKSSPQPADMIIIKECSSYFPSDMRRDKELVQQWVQEIRQKNIAVMLATVVPVTRERARSNPGKQEGIREFNDWLRAYARQQALPLLDLERALRVDDKERYLRDDLTSGDGSHLNRKAYDILDHLLIESVSMQSAVR